MLEVALVIAGCDIVVTNQTAARAIAEGIKHPCVLMERWDLCPNVDFVRPGVYDGDAVREFLSRQAAIPSVRDALVAEAHKATGGGECPPAVQDAQNSNQRQGPRDFRHSQRGGARVSKLC